MDCYICEEPMRSHIMRILRSTMGDPGFALICIACAINHRIDGRLQADKDDPDVTRWLHFQEERDLTSEDQF